MRAVVIAGGAITSPSFYKDLIQKDDTVICADSGYQNALRMGVVPDVVIGDFDSFDEKQVRVQEKITLPVEKDQTDAHAAICLALEKGFHDILFLGALGTRLDHSLANIQLLKLGLEHHARITMIDEHNELFLLNREAVIPRKEGYVLSLLPLTPVSGVCTKGLYYALDGADMEIGNPYGVSNEFTGDRAIVTIEDGLLFVILSKD